jgi:HK97 family phage portal protein
MSNGILSGLFEKRMLDENSGRGFMSRGLGAFETATGVIVNQDAALRASAVYACVDILSSSIAMLPLHTLRKVDTGAVHATEHYLYSLLHDIANQEMTSYEVRRLQMVSVLLRGNSYNYLEINQRGEITAIWPLDPDSISILRDSRTYEKWYACEMPEFYGGGFQVLHSDYIWHWTGLATKRGIGLTPIQMHRQSIGLSLATEEYSARFFSNGAVPGFILMHPGELSQPAYDRLKESWENRHKGVANSNKLAILEEGMEAKTLGVSPTDAKLLETEKHQDTKIARIFRVPPHMIADLERSTNNNIEYQGQEFVQFSLMHWLVNYEKSGNMHLLTPEERKTYYLKHSVDGLMRGNQETRYKAYSVALQNGFKTINDVLRLEDENTIGPKGDVRLVPLNMALLDDVISGRLDESDDAGPVSPRSRFLRDYFSVETEERSVSMETAPHVPGRSLPRDLETRAANSALIRHRYTVTYQRVIKTTAERIVRREVNDISGQLKKLLERGYDAFFEWLSQFYKDHEEFVYKNMLPILQTYAEIVADTAMEEIDAKVGVDSVERFTQAYTREYAKRHGAIGEKRLVEITNKAIEAGDDIESKVQEELDHWKEAYPATIARREAVRNNNAVAHFVYAASSIVTILRWATFGENCPYCDSLNGKKVGINEAFLLAGEALQPNGASALINHHDTKHPPVHDGCDCMVVAGG